MCDLRCLAATGSIVLPSWTDGEETRSQGQCTMALLMPRTPDSTCDGIDHSRKGSNMRKLALYGGDHSLTDRRNLFHYATCKCDWRHPFTIASHILQASHNELREICQCLSLLMQYLSRNLVSQLSGPQYEFRQLGKIRWRDPVRMFNKQIQGCQSPKIHHVLQQTRGPSFVFGQEGSSETLQADLVSRSLIRQYRPPSSS